MRRFLNNRLSNYNNVGDKVDDFCEDCENRWLPFSRVWWDSTEKNIANIKRKDNGIFVIKKILSLINSISESIKDIYDRINAIEPPILSEKLIELENDYLEVGVTADDKQEDLNIAIYENYINLKNTKVDKPLIESTSDSLKIVALDNQGESVFIKSSEVGKVKSVNNKIGDVILKTSDLENDSDYTTNLKLNQERDERISGDNLKLDKPTTSGTTTTHPNIVGVDDLGNSAKLKASDFGKVKSVNGKEGDVILKTSDLENDSDYTTNATLSTHTSNKANPHNVTKEQVGLGNVDNTSDLNKPISTATQTELNRKLDKPTTNNTPDYVLLADGSTAPKSDFGKVDKVMGVEPDADKNVDISGVAMNWTNENHRWSNLPNKSADATYDKVMILDSDGKAGVKDLDFVPYTGANKSIDLNTQKVTHNGIVSNVNSITSPWLTQNTALTSNNNVTYLIIDGFTANTYRQLYIEVESVSGNGELKRLVKGFNVNFASDNIIGSSGDSRYLEVTGSEGNLRYGIGEVEKHSDTALKIPLILIYSSARSINKISVKAYTGSVSNLTFSVENDAESTLTTETPYLYRNASEKWVNNQLSGYVPTSRTLTAGNGLSGGGNLTANRTFTLGTPSAITLSSTNSVTTSSHTHAFIPGGTTAQYIRGDGSLATMPTIPTVNNGTLTVLNTGTATTQSTWTSAILNDWLNGKNFAQASNVFAKNEATNWTNENQRWSAIPDKSADATYNKVMVLDADGKAGTKDAGDLGKNFSNTDLEITENRKHTGTASVELAMPMIYSNPSQRFSGLVDKSADATYNALLGMDSQGNSGKLTALGNVLESGLQTISSAQALRIGQLLNGGQGSAGAISVNLISPPIVQNRFDSVEYVLLMGANLLLNSTDMSISICDENKNVIQQIPNNQIINNSSSELVFYYNFYQFNTGVYFIKITSGVKVYYTTLDLRVVQEVQDINVDNLVWESNYASSEVKNPSTSVEGRNFAITTYKNEDENQTPVISYKTSEIFAQGEDFYIELNLTVSAYIPNTVVGSNMRSYIGLGYSSSPNSLAINSLINVSYRPSDISKYVLYNNSINVGNKTTPHTSTIIFIKTGNLFRTIVENTNHSTTLSNNSGYSLFINIPKRLKAESINGQITKAFKFN